MGQKPDKLKLQSPTQDTSKDQIPEQFDKTKYKYDEVMQQINKSQSQESLLISKWGFMLDQNFGILLGQLISKQVQLVNLKLDLSINNLQKDGVIGLFENFINLDKLQMLIIQLSENKLLDEGVAGMIKGISQCKNLQHLQLNLSFNKITGDGANLKPLQNLKNLVMLNLNFERNAISQNGLESITSDLSSIINLQTLKLSFKNNQIQCIDSLSYLSQLENLRQLELQFQSNQITIQSFNKWQSDIKNGFKQLNSLELNFEQNNNFKDNSIDKLQLSGIAQIKSLEKFIFSLSQYDLNICQEISKLNNIKILSLFEIFRRSDVTNCLKILSKMVNLRIFEIVSFYQSREDQQVQKIMFKAKRLVVYIQA
ncbi:hypothetical protein ABPG74_021665 [Tetrahymena malaccensis]